MRRQKMYCPPAARIITHQEVLSAFDAAPGQLVPLAALPASWHLLVAQLRAHLAAWRRRPCS